MICIFGFDFDPTDGDCHLTTNIAGKVDATDGTDLFIICPIGYIYTGSGKLCKKAGDRRYMIVAPVVCPSGSQPNSNGECKDIWWIFCIRFNVSFYFFLLHNSWKLYKLHIRERELCYASESLKARLRLFLMEDLYHVVLITYTISLHKLRIIFIQFFDKLN